MTNDSHSEIDSSGIDSTSMSENIGDRTRALGIVPLRSMVKEDTVCQSVKPGATGSEIRVSSSLCVDHLCGCK